MVIAPLLLSMLQSHRHFRCLNDERKHCFVMCTSWVGLEISWRLKRHGALETIKLAQPCPAGPCKELKKVLIVLCSDFLRTRPLGLNVLWENTSSSLKALRSSRIGYVKLRGSLTPASPPPLTRALWKTGCYSWR